MKPAAVITTLLALLLAGQANAAPITKLEGTAGCVVDSGSQQEGTSCTAARALKDVTDVAVSPDGKFAYSASFSSNAVNAFRRDPQTGALQQLPGVLGCIASGPQPDPTCATGRGIVGPTAIAMSPDGKNVYVTGFDLDPGASPPRIRGTLVTFSRDGVGGALTQLSGDPGCFSGDAIPGSSPPSGCPPAPFTNAPTRSAPLATATDVEVSPDGESVITSAFIPGAVTNFKRADTTGALTAEECLGSTKTLFPAGGTSFTDTCTDAAPLETGTPVDPPLFDSGAPADGLAYPTDVEISPDGTRVYAAALGLEAPATAATEEEDEPGAIARFDRNPDSGALTQPPDKAGCIGDRTDPAENCTNEATGIVSPFRVAASPDGQNVYATSLNVFPPPDAPGPGPGALALFDASLAQLAPQPCLQQLGLPPELAANPDCTATVLGLVLPSDVGFSPDGSSLYLTSLFHSVASFERDVASGLLAQDAPTEGCSVDPRNLTGGTELLAKVCQNAVPLNAPSSIEVSPDGANAYVTSGGFLTGQPQFGPGLEAAGITSDNAITVFGPTPPPSPPPPPPPPPPALPGCLGAKATIVATGGATTRGTNGADVIVGTKRDDRIRGRGGDDLICGGGGGDSVRGGGGGDAVVGEGGKDSLNGQGGRDELRGSGRADLLRGGAGRDVLRGEGGRDKLRGNGGADRILGGVAADRLDGGAAKDRCRGGPGRDRLRSCED